MNIEKYEFDVEKIVFLNIIISEFDLRMNSKKGKNCHQLNHFNQSEKNTRFCKIYKLLSTIYQEIFENHSIFDEIDEKRSIFYIKRDLF